MLTLTLQVAGIHQTPQMLTISYQEQGLLYVIQASLSSGVANYKLRSHFLLMNLSTLPFLKRYVKHFQSNRWQRKSNALFLSTIQKQTSASQSTKIIYLPSQCQSRWYLIRVQTHRY